MLKGKRDLLVWANSAWMGPENKKQFRKDVRAFEKAVREDAAKVAEEYCTIRHGGDPSKTWYDARTAERIAAAIRSKGKK